jgi:protein-L-isoaspartate(D-aspartate) O-methyltransferase
MIVASVFGCASGPSEPAGAGEAATAGQQVSDRSRERLEMVREQLEARDITDPAVLAVMRTVPRHEFVPPAQRDDAYVDSPLPIAGGQTISQPYIVAYMTQAAEIEPGDRVLEIGTGSGYQAAVLGEIAKEVYSIEIVPELAESARATLERLGYANVRVRAGDGYEGWPEHAPFDAILVTAAPDHIPDPLVQQLAVGGHMVVPVGDFFQEMVILTKTPKGVVERRTIAVRFVPMTGKARKK